MSFNVPSLPRWCSPTGTPVRNPQTWHTWTPSNKMGLGPDHGDDNRENRVRPNFSDYRKMPSSWTSRRKKQGLPHSGSDILSG